MKLLKRVKWDKVLILALTIAVFSFVSFLLNVINDTKIKLDERTDEVQALKVERDNLERVISNQESELFQLRWNLSTAEDTIKELKGK